MKFFLGILFWSCAQAVRFNKARLPQDSPLEVTVEPAGNSALKASITNTGSEPIRLLKAGSILDDRAIERAEIYSGSDKLAFEGIRLAIMQSNLRDEAFQTLQAGETVENTWDPAEVHDMSSGGDVNFVVRGSFLTAAVGSTEITDEIPFNSALSSTVDGVAAAKVRRSFVENIQAKRSMVQNDCTGAIGDAQTAAFSNCARLASAALQVAQSGPGDKLVEYFNSESSSVRQQVAGVFENIAQECGSTTDGVAEQYCSDVLSSCDDQSGILAYTVPSMNIMVSCGIYFDELPGLETRCHRQDQATTTLHETTHLRAIAGTQDLAYGYSLAVRLSTSEALDNADTYALFANAIDVGC
ncbi:unnamed protein product [Discula destructiva]